MKNKHIGESFAHAFEGLSHVIWTQKQVKIQLLMVLLVFMLSYFMKIDSTKVLFVLSAVTLVLIAELFNTAIEVVVNMVTETYHPLAKIAKDVAAAGVLLASMYAMIVGAVIFLKGSLVHHLFERAPMLQAIPKPDLVVIVLVGILVLSIFVALAKVRIGHGTILRGGAVSGHSAVAFLFAAAIAVYSNFNPYITTLAFFLAILVAQSRVEGKIHSLAEVIWGAIVALVLMTLLVLLSP